MEPITEAPARRSTYIAPAAEAGRSFAREYQESVSAFRGLMFATAFSLPVLAGIFVGLHLLITP